MKNTKNNDVFLKELREQGVGLLIDYLRGCTLEGIKESVTVRFENSPGLRDAIGRLRELGNKVLKRLGEIFNCVIRVLDNVGLELEIQPVRELRRA